jgi:lipoprotein-anchoring transpeptidase ErfK/SrfK
LPPVISGTRVAFVNGVTAVHKGNAMTKTALQRTRNLKVAAMLAVLIVALDIRGLAQASSPPTQRLVLVSIPDRKLAVLENGEVIARFSVSVGAAVSPSPRGEFEIVSRVANPTYSHGGVVITPGKGNPVGTRWLGLNRKGYGIHGTNTPSSIGHAASHGCIRLRNRDMEKLFTMLRVGDAVEIRGERDEEIAEIFGGDSIVAETRGAGQIGGQ